MFSSAEGAAESFMEMLELSRLPQSFLSQHVRASGLVSVGRLWQMHDEVVRAEKQARLRLADNSVSLRRVMNLKDCLDDDNEFKHIYYLFTGGTGANARMLAVDDEQCCVYVFSLEEIKYLWKVGRKGKGPGEFMYPAGAIFDGRGHLWVYDEELSRMQTFDVRGNFVACFEGQDLAGVVLQDMALSAQGDILVCNNKNNYLAVFGPDGMLLHRVPAAHGQDDIKFNNPYAAFAAADGNIIVWDKDCMRLISSDGVLVKEVKPPELGADEHWSPWYICTGGPHY